MTERNLEVQRFNRGEARRLTEESIIAIPQPDFTKSWHPHSHGAVIEATATAVKQFNLTVSEKTYSVARQGSNMMGLWAVGKRNGKVNAIAFRNSMNKSLSIGYASFLTVIVCTNQITNDSWFVLRKHTSGLTVAELSNLAVDAIGKVVEDFDILDDWHEGLKEYKLEKRRMEQLTVRAMREGVLAPKKFHEFDDLLQDTSDQEAVYDRTLYGFHGALTQVIRDNSLHWINNQNQKITSFVNKVKEGH